jgi:hypothetical protein
VRSKIGKMAKIFGKIEDPKSPDSFPAAREDRK